MWANLTSEKNEVKQYWVPWLFPCHLSLDFQPYWEVVPDFFHLPLVPVCLQKFFWLPFTSLTSSNSSRALAFQLHPCMLRQCFCIPTSYPIPASTFCALPLSSWAPSGVPCWSTLAFCHACYDSPWNISFHIGPDSLQFFEILALDSILQFPFFFFNFSFILISANLI